MEGRIQTGRQVRKDKKQLKRDYQQQPRSIGVFLIRNNVNDKIFLGVGRDLAGIINRHEFQLRNGIHLNKELQRDWNEGGSDSFAFEIVDQVNPPNDPHFDVERELAFLEKFWWAKLQPFGERGYNERKLSREEKLRQIAARLLANSEKIID